MLLSLPKARLITFLKTRLTKFYLNNYLMTDPIYLLYISYKVGVIPYAILFL